MAHFPDLSPYAYGHGVHPGVVHVGWLDGIHDYPKGKVAEHIVAKLKILASRPTELYRGFHICELCWPSENMRGPGDPGWDEWAEPRSSNGEIRVTSGSVTYAAPVLIVHYIQAHGYSPPEEFLRAIMEATPNKRGAGDGGIPIGFHAGRARPTAPSGPR
jgi:hypothetical protein